MRKSPLLELDDPSVRDGSAQDMLMDNVVQQGLHFQMEYSAYQIRAVGRPFTRLQILNDLPPRRVCSERDEEVRFPVLPYHGHGIQVILMHGLEGPPIAL